MINSMNLTDKHILITGASSGIGKATAIYLSQLGAKLTLIARNQEKLMDTFKKLEGKDHRAEPFDLAEVEKIEELVNSIVKEQGPFNGLVHCAGIAPMRPLSMTKYDFLHEVMLINFYSFVELVRCTSKKNRYEQKASFVGMSSIASFRGDKSKTGYCASKAAMDAAVKSMAQELACKNIRVNTIVAGFIKTDMYETYIETAGEGAVGLNISANQYLGVGDPIDIASAIAYLLSDASKFITGTGFVVDGGYLS